MIKRLLKAFGLNNNRYNLDGPIIVYQMGKVGSRSVFDTLLELNLGVPVYHTHILNNFEKVEEAARKIADPTEVLKAVNQGKELRLLIDKNQKQKFSVISLVRDPVARVISQFFQTVEGLILDIRQKTKDASIDIDGLSRAFMENMPPKRGAVWFEQRFQPIFDIDVYSRPFPREKGYDIFKNERFSVLIIRLEDLDACATAALEEFLGIPDIKLKRTNVGDEKWYRDIYNEFKSKITLPAGYLDKMYGSKLATHFYSPEEIEKFRSKWTR